MPPRSKSKGPHKPWFSNMNPLHSSWMYGGLTIKTNENFYQLCKLPKDRTDLRRRVAAMNPFEAKSFCNTNKLRSEGLLRPDWSRELSLQIMRYGLEQKFKPGTIWHEYLLATGDRPLVEHNYWHDNFWGACGCAKCKFLEKDDHLGRLVTEIRAQSVSPNEIFPATRIAVAGSAGRKADADKFSRSVYIAMQNDFYRRLDAIEPDVAQRWLISGGSAWSDHLAVSAYLDGKAARLTLYLPCYFHDGQFHGCDFPPWEESCRILHYYHHHFSEQRQRDSQAEILEAHRKGAKLVFIHPVTTQRNTLFARNLLVGFADHLIAYTWGDGEEPSSAGTSHCWRNSYADEKIHVSIASLTPKVCP